MDKKIHEGCNIKRFREMLGIKQDTLAWELGDDWNQKKISLLEQKEVIDEPLLQRVADIMKLLLEAFKNMTDEQAINIISNSSFDNGSVRINYYPTFNPLDKNGGVVRAYVAAAKGDD
jgi:predicted transcriptional regulator